MTVWTISAQEGTRADRVAAELAAAAGVPLLDHDALAALARDVDPQHLRLEEFDDLEERFGGRFSTLAFTMAALSAPVAAAAVQELQFRQNLPELGRTVLGEAARRPCVILASAAFAALRDHPTALHVRLHAPVASRVATFQREHLVSRDCADKAIAHRDHTQHDLVRRIHRVDLDDARHFAVVLDASRFTLERLVDTLLAAGSLLSDGAAALAARVDGHDRGSAPPVDGGAQGLLDAGLPRRPHQTTT